MSMIDISATNSSSMAVHAANSCDETASVLSVASIVSLEELEIPSDQEAEQPIKRRVGFSVEPVEVVPSASPLEILNHDERNRMWYGARDLENFRTEARDLCRQMRTTDNLTTEGGEQQQQQEEAKAACVSLARDGQTRGLEQRSCLERQRRRYLANKCIVRAQHKLTPDRLAALSFKCTHWASELAQEEAARDFVRAHVDRDENECESPEAVAFDFAVLVNVAAAAPSQKREAAAMEDCRRVRARVSQC